MAGRIAAIQAMEILDSRGNPTVRVFVKLDDGTTSWPRFLPGQVLEKMSYRAPDSDKKRYHGKGVLRAVANVNTRSPGACRYGCHRSGGNRQKNDRDGWTENKSALGANSILGVSMAVARRQRLPVEYLSIVTWAEPGKAYPGAGDEYINGENMPTTVSISRNHGRALVPRPFPKDSAL